MPQPLQEQQAQIVVTPVGKKSIKGKKKRQNMVKATITTKIDEVCIKKKIHGPHNILDEEFLKKRSFDQLLLQLLIAGEQEICTTKR